MSRRNDSRREQETDRYRDQEEEASGIQENEAPLGKKKLVTCAENGSQNSIQISIMQDSNLRARQG